MGERSALLKKTRNVNIFLPFWTFEDLLAPLELSEASLWTPTFFLGDSKISPPSGASWFQSHCTDCGCTILW